MSPPATATPPAVMPAVLRKPRREWRWAASAVSCRAPSTSKSSTPLRSTRGLRFMMFMVFGLRALGLDEAGLLDGGQDGRHRVRGAERLGRRLDRLARVQQVAD